MQNGNLNRVEVFNVSINCISEKKAIDLLIDWSKKRASKAVFLCNVHSVVTAKKEAVFASVLAIGDLVLPDGEPIAWVQRRLGIYEQRRISGPDLMLAYLLEAEKQSQSIFLLGSTSENLQSLKRELQERFPKLIIAGDYSPPFVPLESFNNKLIAKKIISSGAGTVWVSFGCPKQEAWIAANVGNIPAVMIGVGAAFDFHSGKQKRAPVWMRSIGMEWFHRLISEPGRLWKRYLITNFYFLYLVFLMYFSKKKCR